MITKELTLRIGRREFTRQGVLALLAGATITVVNCGGGDSPTSPSPGPGPASGVSGAITGNHGHTAVITDAQITAGNSVTLNIAGTADHPHTLDLTAQEVGRIGARERVQKTSSSDAGHDHVVTFN
jgi:hypothetical protein